MVGNRFTNEQIGFVVDGYIYWLVRSNNTIIEFNLKDEEFRKLSLPFMTDGKVTMLL